MNKVFGKKLLKKKNIELLAPFNTIVFPDLFYISKLTNPQKNLLKKLCIKRVATTQIRKPLSENLIENTNINIETAKQNVTKMRSEMNINKDNKKKNNFKQKLFESSTFSSITKRNDHFLFDPNLRKMMNEYFFDEESDFFPNPKMDKELKDIFINKNDDDKIFGTLNKIDFYKFHYDIYHSEMTHVLGIKPIIIEKEEKFGDFDFKNWILSKINYQIFEYQNKLKNLNLKNFNKDENLAKNKQTLESSITLLSQYIDENNENYIFSDSEKLFEDVLRKNFRFVSYENHESLQNSLSSLSNEEFEKLKDIAIQINVTLRSLLLKANFITSTKFMDINKLANEKYFVSWYNNLIGNLHTRKIFSQEDCLYLLKETDILEKLEFIRIVFKNFQTNYLSQWKNYEEKDKDFDAINKKNEVKEIYDHFKKMEELSFSGPKRELISKIEDFLSKRKLNPKVHTIVKEELERYKELNEMESEYQNTKNYLELITKLPFDVISKDQKSIERARKILNESHFGMDEVKKRILEFLAIGKLKDDFISNKVLCLLGPPGVGKTSIAKDIAKCLDRKFVRISLGGENDPSILKGHRRTYLGAYPGKLLNALKTAQTENPVILLDEIDKLGRSHKGNVQDVLLEILDPMQNKEFNDHYLEAPLDLSKVLFLCSANILDGSTISPALYDRLEVIELSGYTKKEKLIIFNKYLLKKIMKKVGLNEFRINVVFEDEVILNLIDDYARESGVRSLEKNLQIILEKLVYDFVTTDPEYEKYRIKKTKKEINEDEDNEDYEINFDYIENKEDNEKKEEVENKEDKEKKEGVENNEIKENDFEDQEIKEFILDKEKVRKYLGPKIFGSSTIVHKNDDLIGFSFGLGYNTIGGSVLSIEVLELPDKKIPRKTKKTGELNDSEKKLEIVIDNNIVPKKKKIEKNEGSLKMTGSLGEVMKESVEISYTYAKNFMHKNIPRNHFLETKNLHIHFPAGASKKDGPSAGVTIVTALISMALQKPYNINYAMTGEISLNGRVMKIGGIREKILAAKREGITNIFIPYGNKNDVEELKDYIKEGMSFIFVRKYKEIYKELFEKKH